jgi:hypothetical protein
MRRGLQALDDLLERLATAVFGPQPLGYRPRPSLWTKLGVFGIFAVLVLIIAFRPRLAHLLGKRKEEVYGASDNPPRRRLGEKSKKVGPPAPRAWENPGDRE